MVKQMVRSNMYMLYRSTYYITKENTCILFISTSIDADGQIFTMQNPASRLRKITALNIKLVSIFFSLIPVGKS